MTMESEIQALVEDIIEKTSIPANHTSRTYLTEVVNYLERKYKFIARLKMKNAMDDGVSYGQGN